MQQQPEPQQLRPRRHRRAASIGLACAWRAAQARHVGARARARRAGRRRIGRRRRDARAGHRGRLRRGGAARAEPRGRELWRGFAAELEEARGDCRAATRRRARWWWPPTATTPRSCAACTTSSAGSGSTPSGSPRASAASSSRASRRVSAARSCAPSDGHADPRAVVRRSRRPAPRGGGDARAPRRGDSTRDERGAGDGRRDRRRAHRRRRRAGGGRRVERGRARAPHAPPVRPVKGQLLALRVRPGHAARAADHPHAALLRRRPRATARGRDRRDGGGAGLRHGRRPPTGSSACSRRRGRCCPTWASWSWSRRAPGFGPARRTTPPVDRPRRA